MRALFFGNPAFGHLVPQIPLARALREQGHQVAFVTAASMTEFLGAEQFENLAVGPEMPVMAAEVDRRTGINVLADPVTDEAAAELFAGVRIEIGYQDSLAAAREWKPDLVVAETLDFIGPMVAAAIGVPAATLTFGPELWPGVMEVMRKRAETSHREVGLDVEPARWFLDVCPPSLQVEDWQVPAGHIALRPEAYNGGVSAPSGTAGVKCDRPTVLVSFGTLFVIPQLITPIVQELLRLDVDIRVTLGPMLKENDFEIDSPRVEFVGFTPLARLLPDADVVLTVGGAGTLLGALSEGIPLVMTPLGADQPHFASLAVVAGAGITFETGKADPRDVAEAVATVLREPTYRTAARRVAAEIAAMHSPSEVAGQLTAHLA